MTPGQIAEQDRAALAMLRRVDDLRVAYQRHPRGSHEYYREQSAFYRAQEAFQVLLDQQRAEREKESDIGDIDPVHAATAGGDAGQD